MARKPTQRQRLEALLARHTPEIRRAFEEAVRDIRSNAQIARIVERLESRDIEGAIRAVGVDAAAFRGFEEATRQAYIGGGGAAAAGITGLTGPDGARLIIRFDARSPRAEAWLTNHSSQMVTRIVDDQRGAIRQALFEGMERGVNPRTTALDIVGRIDRATGRRSGGIVGMTEPQSRFVSAARAELASGDPALLRNYLTRARRDRRFDRLVTEAIREGRGLDQQTVTRMTGRYADRLVALRGETIARTESMAALNQSQIEAYRQAVDAGGVQPQNVRKVWVATRDGRTRDSHARIDRESVGIEEAFSNGLMFPGDPNGPASEIVNCRCTMMTRVDHLANLE